MEKIKISTFKGDLKKWYDYMAAPINMIDIPTSKKKRVKKLFETGFAEKLKTKCDYNQRMDKWFWYCRCDQS
jgi:hypothetical protein